MIDRTQDEIVKAWQGDKAKPIVSIRCTTYNHEKYISQCLDGFLMQETTFPFEIVIHDDASTDRTASIIREYEKNYPCIIKPIYETENQYSKGNGELARILNKHMQGKYIALCEGDDYWCDAKKLQLQYDYLEKHPEAVMCAHNTQICDLTTGKITLFNHWNKEMYLCGMDVFRGWNVHLSSFFMRKSLLFIPKEFRYWFGDFVILTSAFAKGCIGYIPMVMSVYRLNNPDGITYNNSKVAIKKENERIEYLEKFNLATNKKFANIVTKVIQYNSILLNLPFEAVFSIKSYNEYRKVLSDNREGFNLFEEKQKIKMRIISSSYLLFVLANLYKVCKRR